MPSNIFATTGTNVSIVFIDGNAGAEAVLIDASNLGKTVKEGKNQKTILNTEEEQKITKAFNEGVSVEGFSKVVSLAEIGAKNYSFSAGQYFEVKIEYTEISKEDFDAQLEARKDRLSKLLSKSTELNRSLNSAWDKISYAK